MQLLENWATARLEALGVDGVFAPYIVGMLDQEEQEDSGDVGANIHQVLMGWLAPEDEERAQEFVDDLVKYKANPSLLEAEEAEFVKTAALVNKVLDIKEIVGEKEELKASAPTFVPRGLTFVPVTTTDKATGQHNTGGSEEGDQAEQVVYVEKAAEGAEADDNGKESLVDAADGDDEDSFFWSVAYELVSHLQLKFPDIDPNRLCDLLRLVELDVNQAHAVLKATMDRESTGTTQVCRHYLQGDCRRADCMFMHDTHAITCRFWLRGSCLQDKHCVFAHDFTEFYTMDASALGRRDYDSEDEIDDEGVGGQLDFQAEEMFPSLQSSAAVGAGSYPSQDVSNLSLNFARAVSLQPLVGPPATNDSSYGNSRRPIIHSQRSLHHKGNGVEVYISNKWLSTGHSVGAQYLELREEAYQMACARNKCFMGATQAYRNGNRALAKSLSNQGHDYNAQMKHLHYLAATEIFESRNPSSQIYNDRLMDLHGLHVAEVVELLSQMLPKLAEEGLDTICLVTGSGHHSKGPQSNARLLPAVERFLTTEGYHYNPMADGRGYVGMLMVDLCW